MSKKSMKFSKPIHWLALSSLAGLLAMAPVHAENAPIWVDSYTQPDTGITDVSQLKRFSTKLDITPSIVSLEAPSSALFLNMQFKPSRTGSGAQQIGIAREIAQTTDVATTASMLFWQPTENSQSAAISFRSPEAKGVRLGILIDQIPLGTQFRFFPQNGGKAFEVSGYEMLNTIQQNLDAGDSGDSAHTYWVPNLGSTEVTMRIELPLGISPSELKIAIPSLSHYFITPAESFASQKLMSGAASCNVNVACNSAALNSNSNSVALMDYTSGGDTYFCTGTLLNDQRSSGTPYFLSANHCISTQSEASSLATDWFYRSPICATAKPTATVTLTGGATLLANNQGTDMVFMRLNQAPPKGVTFAGWTTAATPVGTSVMGIHHPVADTQKVSTGSVRGFQSCMLDNDEYYDCDPAPERTASHLVINFTRGIVESGSSGSGIFSTFNGKYYFIGQLTGSADSGCSAAGNFSADYGRFSTAFSAANLGRWLQSDIVPTVRTPIYRFFNILTETHFFTASVEERDQIIKNNLAFRYEGPAFFTYSQHQAGTSPIFRFFNTKTGMHFFTISEVERDAVLKNLPHFNYEGIGWYGSTEARAGAVPIYRFFMPKTGVHFYTVSEAEKAHLIKNSYDYYSYEGIAYYAWTGA